MRTTMAAVSLIVAASTVGWAPRPETPMRSLPPAGQPRETITLGRQVYAQNCAMCHGASGEGLTMCGCCQMGPRLAGTGMSAEAIRATVTGGLPPMMPAFAGFLPADQINAVSAFVRSLAVGSPPAMGTRAGAASGAAGLSGTEAPVVAVAKDGTSYVLSGGTFYKYSADRKLLGKVALPAAHDERAPAAGPVRQRGTRAAGK